MSIYFLMLGTMAMGWTTDKALIQVPFIPQRHSATCLVAAAAMVMQYYGEGIDHDGLWSKVRFYNDGTSCFEIQNAISAMGYTSYVYQEDMSGIKGILKIKIPVIAMVDIGTKHSVVVRGFDEKRRTISIWDPGSVLAPEIGEEEFIKKWDKQKRQVMVILPKTGKAELPNMAKAVKGNSKYRAVELSLINRN